MNRHEAIRNVGKIVKIRPPVRNSAMHDGDWLVVEVTKHFMRIAYLPSGHVATLGNDCIQAWDEDYRQPNRGYLKLKRQLSFHGCNIDYEP